MWKSNPHASLRQFLKLMRLPLRQLPNIFIVHHIRLALIRQSLAHCSRPCSASNYDSDALCEDEEIRTLTPFDIRFWDGPVYQFQHTPKNILIFHVMFEFTISRRSRFSNFVLIFITCNPSGTCTLTRRAQWFLKQSCLPIFTNSPYFILSAIRESNS